MFSREAFLILCIFDICGYNTGSTTLSRNKKIMFLIFSFQFTSVMILTVYKFFLITDLFVFFDIFGVINEMVQYTFGLYTYWLIIFDSLQYREDHRQFWKTYLKIDEYFCSQNIHFRNFLLRFIEYFSVSLLLYSLISTPNTLSIYMFYVLMFASELRAFYYIFCLEIIQHQLKMIENELKIMNEFSHKVFYRINNTGTSPFYIQRELQRFKWIREYFHHVHQMSIHLNSIFGLSHVFVILYCFYTWATDMIWFYSIFNERSLTQIICKSFKINWSNICEKLLIIYPVVVTSFWIGHMQLIIVYMFCSANNCFYTVNKKTSPLKSFRQRIVSRIFLINSIWIFVDENNKFTLERN